MKWFIASLMLIYVSAVYGVDMRTLKGQLYRDARVTRTDAVGVMIIHSAGACYIPFTNLPISVRTAYKYDPAAAAAYLAAQRTAAEKRQQAVQRKKDERASRLTHSSSTTTAVAVTVADAITTTNSVEKHPSPFLPECHTSTPVPRISSRQHHYAATDYSARSYDTGRVYVREYYRKDGTHVRAHTRRK